MKNTTENRKRVLVIQTAFIGDAILASSLLETLRASLNVEIDLLVKKGNEQLFAEHPFLKEVFVLDKTNGKLKNLFALLGKIRTKKYDVVINLHRFASTGILTAFSGAGITIGFDKNPFSFLFTYRSKHEIGNGKHEIQRNYDLIKELVSGAPLLKPKLYPTNVQQQKVSAYAQKEFVCIAPSSVWFTKQFPEHKWVELINNMPDEITICLLGAPSDNALCERIKDKAPSRHVVNLCGKLSLLESAALMKLAKMNYVNDSAPMHLASSVNAPVTVIYCSTVPSFGFGPLSDNSRIVEIRETLDCRPCGLHGYAACPKGHFKCAEHIEISQIL